MFRHNLARFRSPAYVSCTAVSLDGMSSKSSILKMGRCLSPWSRSLNGLVFGKLVIDSTLNPSPLALETLLVRLRLRLPGVQPLSISLAEPLRLREPLDRPKKYKLSSASESSTLPQLKMLRSSIHSLRWLKNPLAILGNENWLFDRLTVLLALGLGAILKILSAAETQSVKELLHLVPLARILTVKITKGSWAILVDQFSNIMRQLFSGLF